MVNKCLIIVALASKDDGTHCINHSLSVVPPVEPRDQVTPHDKVQQMSILVLLVQSVHQIHRWNRLVVLNLYVVHLNWKISREEVFQC